jgi:adenylate cyclase
LTEAGLPLWRAYVAVSTLHPMFIGKGRTWRRDGGLISASFRRDAPDQENWRNSSLHHLVQTDLGELRRRLEGANAELDFAVLEEFQNEGAIDYLVFVTPFSERPDALARRDGMVTSWVTDQAGGFTDGHVATLRRRGSSR